jgi:hypothetical protein
MPTVAQRRLSPAGGLLAVGTDPGEAGTSAVARRPSEIGSGTALDLGAADSDVFASRRPGSSALVAMMKATDLG